VKSSQKKLAASPTLLRLRRNVLLYYRGRTIEGTKIDGSIDVRDRPVALQTLQARGVFVTSLDAAATPRGMLAGATLALRRDGAARLAAFRSLSALIEAGVPLRRSLDTVTMRPSHDTVCEALRSVAGQVEAGVSLSRALESHPHEFSAISIAIVRAGEAGGSLDEALRTIAEWEERDRNLRRRITAALTYPAVVTMAAAALLLFLIGNTIPAFAVTFAQMHARLPLITRLLVRAGAVLDSPLFLPAAVLAGMAIVAFVLALRARRPGASSAIDRLRLRLPLVGSVLAKAAAARLARTLGSLLHAGVDVIASIEICTGVVGPAHRACLERVTTSLRRGDGLVRPFEESGLFEPSFVQLIRSGEESGCIDSMLLRIARFYENDVETSLVALTSILEPFLICTLGLAVGTIVASIIIPLYSMIGNIQ
jgi:type II secretory pathway component PulF